MTQITDDLCPIPYQLRLLNSYFKVILSCLKLLIEVEFVLLQSLIEKLKLWIICYVSV